MGMSVVISAASVIAAPPTVNGWVQSNGIWYYYKNGIMVKNGWAKDSKGWCFLNAIDGSWVQEGWAKDSIGWGYIQNGYWVEHEMWAKDARGWNHIQANGYWDGKPAVAVNPQSVTTVASVSAVNSTTLTITGINLTKLTAADVKLAGNSADSVTVSADGTIATIILDNVLIADADIAVTVLGQGFIVNFSIDASSVAVTSTAYDNDTSDQYVAITVNGNATTIADLVAAGYDVEFSAFAAKSGGSNITSSIFKDDAKGLLLDNLNTYLGSSASKSPYIQVTITKGSNVVVSPLQKITIQNQNLVANSISGYTLTNSTSTYATKFDQNSTTLVTGETAYFKNIKIIVDGSVQTVNAGIFTVKSSNTASVYAASDGTLQAIAPGTATLTITYGNVTKTVSFTVTNSKRELSKVVVQKENTDTIISTLKVAKKLVNIELVALDQYGDPINAKIYPKSSNALVVAALSPVDIDASKSGALITFTPIDTGSTTISFYDSAAFTYKIPNSALSLSVSENGDVNKSILELYTPISDSYADSIVTGTNKSNFSDDATIDISDDKYVVYQLNQYNSDDVSLGYAVFTKPITVSSSRSDVLAGNAVTVDGNKIIIKAGTNVGTATIKVTDPVTGLIYTKTITVVDQANTINSVAFKSITDPIYSKTYNYKSVLTITGSGNDPIVNGITLKKSISQAIRIHLTDDSNGMLYIDKNGDGLYNNVTSADDTLLGSFTISVVGDIADTDTSNGVTVVSGEDGTIIFKVLDTKGNVVAAASIADNF